MMHRALWRAVGRYARRQYRRQGPSRFAWNCIIYAPRTACYAIRYEWMIFKARHDGQALRATAFWNRMWLEDDA